MRRVRWQHENCIAPHRYFMVPLMRFLVGVVRVIAISILVLTFLIHMSGVWLVVRERWRRIRISNRLLSSYCRVGLICLGLRVQVFGAENMKSDAALFVGNHLSYMDVLAISSRVPACFVTSREIRAAPLLGQVCLLAGCLFVDRRNRHNILNEVSELGEGLRIGLNVAIFPEATSTNGEQILRFRRALFVSAIETGRPVIPFCLNYRTVGAKPIDRFSRDKIMWYGDMGFAPHIWALASSGGVTLDLHFLPAIPTHVEMNPTALTEQSQRAVESVFRPIATD